MGVTLALSAGWEQVRKDREFFVERRELDGVEAGMYEVRASTRSFIPPVKLFETIWRSEDYPSFVPYVKEVEILQAKERERLIYQRQSVPVVQDRDYTVRVRYEHDASTGLYQILVKSEPDAGPAVRSCCVRIRRTRASWTLEPAENGGTDITYAVASEAGGSVPQWMVNAAQKDSIVDYLKVMLARAAQNAKNGK
jgi:ribosome-associated toxin RatA of RatAB toxin-antitoxin module